MDRISRTTVPVNSPRLAPPTQGASPVSAPAAPEPGETVVLSSRSPDLVEKLRTRIKPGTLYILDSFGFLGSMANHGLSSYAMYAAASEETHGKMVSQAARDTGFQGQVVGISDDGERSDSELQERYGYRIAWEKSDDPQVLSDSLNQYLVGFRADTLTDASQELMNLYEAGAERSVINLSSSSSQVKTVDLMINQMVPGNADNPEEVQKARRQRNKVALAVGVPRDAVESDDPQIRSQVREVMLERLVDRIAAVDSHPNYVKAKDGYDTAVELLNSKKNSVVVAAGNQQESADFLRKMFDNNPPPQLSDEFFVNDLSNARTVVVGAMDKDQIASYSCRYPSVEIFANGNLGEDHGTSIAAPRVGAMLAILQQADLQAGPRQLQSRLRAHYCIPMEGGQIYLLADQTRPK